MMDSEIKHALKDLPSMQEITDKRIVNFMMRQHKYFEPVKYGKKYYILTFNDTVYPATMQEIIAYTDRVLAEK